VTPRRSASRPPGLVVPLVVTLVVFLGLSVAGIVLLLEGHSIGTVLIVAGMIVAGVFWWWSRRRWAEHRA
jgi:high-affinity Fe2+/Pb2+ permease